MTAPSELTPSVPPDYEQLRNRLNVVEATLRAIRSGAVDALVEGERIYSLRGAETPYRLLIEAMGEGAGTVTREGIVLYANRRLAEMLSVPLEELIGASIRPWVAAADRTALDAWLMEGARRHVTGELNFHHPNGELMPIHLALSPLELPGSPSLCLVATDLTASKEVEAALRRTNRALRMVSACDHILVKAVDEAELLTEICQAIVGEGGYRLAWVGEAIPDAAKSIAQRAWAGPGQGYLREIQVSWADTEWGLGIAGTAIRTGQPLVIANITTDPRFVRWRDQATAAGLATGAGFPLPTPAGVWGVLCIYSEQSGAFNAEEMNLLTGLANDLAYGVTAFRLRAEHAAAEAKIHQLNAELEQRVRARTVDLEAANTELEAFVYTVAHDLRAPLRSIDGFSRILMEDCGERLSPVERGHLERVRVATVHMEQLIEGMLRLSGLTRSELRSTTVNLSAQALRVLADLQRQDPERTVAVVVAPNLLGQGDPSLLQAVLENLLGNAWKFTAKTALARIEFGCGEKDGVPTYFVHDNGAGFNMAYRGKLFGVFQRLHRNDEFPGTGVGLASVQRIIHRHHGRVWAESDPVRGTTFYFTLQPAPKRHE
jgi:PAS domain S-box-containing protein